MQAVAPDVEANSEENSATATPESYEKQESLIALAWSKPTDCDTADAGQSPDVKGSEMTPILPAQSTETVQQGDGEEQKSALAPCDPQSADQTTTVEQVEHQRTELYKYFFCVILSNFIIVYKREKKRDGETPQKKTIKCV